VVVIKVECVHKFASARKRVGSFVFKSFNIFPNKEELREWSKDKILPERLQGREGVKKRNNKARR